MDSEEKLLWERYTTDRSDANRNVLVERHYPLSYKVAIYFFSKMGCPPFTSVEELQAEAVMGLIRAVELFEPERGLAFSTYGYRSMLNRIQKYLNEWNETPAHWSPDRKDEIRSRKVSLSSMEAKGHQVGRCDPERTVLVTNWLEKLKKFLPSRDHQILTVRYGDNGRTLEECGEVLGITRERVRQIEARAIRRLQGFTESQLLFENDVTLSGIRVSELTEADRPQLDKEFKMESAKDIDPIQFLESLTTEQVQEKIDEATRQLSAWKQIQKIISAKHGNPKSRPAGASRAKDGGNYEDDIKAVRAYLKKQDGPVDARAIGDATGVKWPRLKHVVERMDDVTKQGNSFLIAE